MTTSLVPGWTLRHSPEEPPKLFLHHKPPQATPSTSRPRLMSATDPLTDMFAPPVNRAMKVLDRSFFQRTVPTSAARIFNPKDISRCRKELTAGRDTLPTNRIDPIRADPDPEVAQKGTKCLLLRPDVIHSGEFYTRRGI